MSRTQENEGSACGTEGKLETAQYYEGSQSEYERFYSSINENFRANKIEDVRIQNNSRTPQSADSCAVVHYEART